jgi:spermidine synthase
MPYVVIALVSAATLASELLLTRVLSFVFWNHLVYLIITLCLLGYGAASTGIAVGRSRLARLNESDLLAWCLVGFAVSLIAALFGISRASLALSPELFRVASLLKLLGIYAISTLPFVFAGAVVLLLLMRDDKHIAALYAWDLCGAAAGCGMFLVTIRPLGAPRAIVLQAAIALALATYMLASKKPLGSAGPVRRRRPLAITIAVASAVATVAFAVPDRAFPLRVEVTKLLAAADPKLTPDAQHELAIWTPLMRIDVAYSPSGSIDRILEENTTDHRVLTHDGDAATFIFGRDESWPRPEDRDPSRPRTTTEIAFTLKNQPEVLIIGVGGGRDIGMALQNGARHVDAVELNQATYDLLTGSGPYAAYGGRLYERPEVEVHVGEGRSFLRRSSKQYDFIQMSGIDTYAALSSGAYVLAENYLYTVDAVRDYLDHLRPDGVMNIWRWYEWEQPRETLRVFSVVLEALRRHGAKDPAMHVFVAAQWWGGSTIFKKTPFTKAEITQLREYCADNKISVIHSPDWGGLVPYEALKNPFYALAETYRSGQQGRFYAGYPFDVSPVTDDKPFFYEYLRISKLFDFSLTPEGTWGRHVLRSYWSYVVMAADLAAAGLATALFIWVPLWAFRRKGIATPRRVSAAAFFASIGLGFIALELALTQKLVLYLGHPMHAIAVVITTILAATGLGSMIAGKFDDPAKVVRRGGLLVPVWVALFLGPGNWLLEATLGASFAIRLVLVVLMLTPIGLTLGLFFPSGLRIVAGRAPEFVAWAWGINAGFTVLGSIGSIVLALSVGFSRVLFCAAVLYIVAALALWRFSRGAATQGAAATGEALSA